MSEKEAIEWLKDISNFSTYDLVYVEALLQLLEQKDKRIDELEKSLVEEDLKHRNKIKELEADLYSANCTINEYIEERNKLKDKMIGDRMEQFDDYVIYLIESYLEIMGEQYRYS